MADRIRIQEQDFDLAEEYQLLRQTDSAVGAVVTFSGLVRDFEVGAEGADSVVNSIDSLSLQHYPGMTESLLAPKDQIVLVGVASQHRADAFEAAQFLMDYLKTHATFWKSVKRNGEQQWIESKVSDQQAAARWDNPDEK
jgi:molybdopterin synthase catalytic subunit